MHNLKISEAWSIVLCTMDQDVFQEWVRSSDVNYNTYIDLITEAINKNDPNSSAYKAMIIKRECYCLKTKATKHIIEPPNSNAYGLYLAFYKLPYKDFLLKTTTVFIKIHMIGVIV